MKKCLFGIIIILFVLPVHSVFGESLWEGFKANLEVNGYIENETAFRFDHPRTFSKVQNLLQLETRYYLTGDLMLYGLTWLKYDAAFDSDRYGPDASKRYRTNLRFKDILRELYLEGLIDDIAFSLGRQQVVWGEAVGLRITDIINPQDFREFILDDFIDSRIPLWMLKVEYTIGEWDIETLMIPDFEPDQPAEPDSEWNMPSPLSYKWQSAEMPADGLKDMEAGIRLSRLFGGWDLSASYFYAWDDRPALHIKEVGPEKQVFPEHHRLHTIGFTFNNAFGRWVPRGEFALNLNKFFRISELEVAEGVIKRDNLFYMIGTDYTVSDNLLINGQFVQRFIFNYKDGMIDDKVQNILSLLFQTNFINETLRPDILIIYDANERDLLIRPKAAYDLNDRVKLTFGADIIEGGSKGFIGQFDGNDRIFFEAKYSF
ncbi:MAG: DUF1302 family protein [Thermodesulfobacteriota bacterium]